MPGLDFTSLDFIHDLPSCFHYDIQYETINHSLLTAQHTSIADRMLLKFCQLIACINSHVAVFAIYFVMYTANI